jgi:rhodanese-related sulfurtransferase
LAEEQEGTEGVLFGLREEEVPRITPEELQGLQSGPSPPVVLDVRSRSSYERDSTLITASIRVLPDQVTEWAADQHPDGLVATYCT